MAAGMRSPKELVRVRIESRASNSTAICRIVVYLYAESLQRRCLARSKATRVVLTCNPGTELLVDDAYQDPCGVLRRDSHLRMKTRFAALAAIAAVGVLLPATASAQGGTVLFNSQVNMTAPPPPPGQVDNFPQNKQNEPGIALDPQTGALIAGSNDEIDEPLCHTTATGTGSCPFAPNVGTSGVYFSMDRGVHWTQPSFTESASGVGSCEGRVIHTLPGYCEQNLESLGDPNLAVGPALKNGKFSFANGSVVYYANLAMAASGAGLPSISISRSIDDGASWKAPVTVSTSSDNPVDFNDKINVWADANPNSPFFGNVYASWTLFIGAGRFGKSNTFEPEPIVFARSTDGGQTWSHIIRLSQSANNGTVGGRQGSLIRSGPDGTVYVIWKGSINLHSEQLLAVSHDGGGTFGGPMPVAAVNDIPSPLGGSSFRDNSFPSADVNQQTGALYVVWANEESTPPTALIKFTESDDGGLSWTTPKTVRRERLRGVAGTDMEGERDPAGSRRRQSVCRVPAAVPRRMGWSALAQHRVRRPRWFQHELAGCPIPGRLRDGRG